MALEYIYASYVLVLEPYLPSLRNGKLLTCAITVTYGREVVHNCRC